MDTWELVDTLEPSDGVHLIPDNVPVKMMAADGSVWGITGIEYQETTNTVWLRVEPEN